MNYVPQLKYASQEQIEQLHGYGVEILKRFGMRVEDPEIRKMLCENGCTEKGDRVYFCDDLIEKTIKNQKKQVVMTSTTGSKLEMEIGKTF